jgi:hypothetical protein
VDNQKEIGRRESQGCELCEGRGYLTNTHSELREAVILCPREDCARRDEYADERLRHVYSKTVIPPEYRRFTPDDWRIREAPYESGFDEQAVSGRRVAILFAQEFTRKREMPYSVEFLNEMAKLTKLKAEFTHPVPGLFLYGAVGIGKTALMCTAANVIIPEYRSHVRICTWRELYGDILKAMKADQPITETMSELSLPFMFVDNLPHELSDYEAEMMMTFFDQRYSLPTIVTSRHAPDVVREGMGEWVANRLFKACVAVRMAGVSLHQSVPVFKAD